MRHINAPAFKPSEFTHRNFDATVETGTTIEDCKQPGFWMHVADQLTPSDKITVYAADQSFYAELLVLGKTRVEARVAVINFTDLSSATNGQSLGDELAKYDISWAGPANKWRIVHKDSKDVIRDGFDNEAAARTFLITDHLAQKPSGAAEPSVFDKVLARAQTAGPVGDKVSA